MAREDAEIREDPYSIRCSVDTCFGFIIKDFWFLSPLGGCFHGELNPHDTALKPVES